MNGSSAPLDAETVFKRLPDVVLAEVGGEAVVYDTRTGALQQLNSTAALLWKCLDGAASLGEIVADFSDAFGVPSSEVDAECRSVIGLWIDHGIVRAAEHDLEPADVPTSDGIAPPSRWRHLANPPNA